MWGVIVGSLCRCVRKMRSNGRLPPRSFVHQLVPRITFDECPVDEPGGDGAAGLGGGRMHQMQNVSRQRSAKLYQPQKTNEI